VSPPCNSRHPRCKKATVRSKNLDIGSFSTAGLPDGIFQTEIPIWVSFGGPRYIYVMAIKNVSHPFGVHILWPFGVINGHFGTFYGLVILYSLLVFGLFCCHNCVIIRYIFPSFCILYQEKFGSPALQRHSKGRNFRKCTESAFLREKRPQTLGH
jgi:hypothetical protein